MRSVFTILLFLFLFSQLAFAQKYSVTGIITDEKADGLPAATVLLLHPKDSSNIYNALSDVKGAFDLKNIIKGEYIFKVSYLGFSVHYQRITVKPEVVALDLGPIALKPISSLLGEIDIKGERSPIVFKKDTIEFNAASYTTPPNSAVEELIKKLPGIEIKDGAIKAQGQAVTKVLVDGKEFFGSDAAIALKNLPADAISKIQVVDSKSEEAQFTGVEDGKREKVINLTLKKDKKQMGFGKATAGAGTDNRYVANLNYNRFDKGNQLSVLGMSNNINIQGFSYQDVNQFNGGNERRDQDGGGEYYYNNTGERGVPTGGTQQNGNTYSNAGGLNFFHKLNKKLEANGSYFLNHSDQGMRRNSITENFLPTGNFISSDSSRQDTRTFGHTVNLALDYKPDSTNAFKLTSSFRINNRDFDSDFAMQRFSPDGDLRNKSQSAAIFNNNSLSGSLRIMYRHRFRKKGRTSSSIFNFSNNHNGNSGLSDVYTWYDLGREQRFKRDNTSLSTGNNYSLTLSFSEPLGKKFFLETNYNLNDNLNNARSEVYNITPELRRFNDSLSTRTNTDIFSQRVGFTIRKGTEKYSFSAGAGLQHQKNYARLYLLGTHIIQKEYLNILPQANLNYNLTKFRHLGLYYYSYINAPHYSQLQPVIVNTDSLNKYLSNPNLKPAFYHSGNINFNSYNPVNHISYYLSMGSDYTANSFAQSITYDEKFLRIIQTINVKNNYSFRVNGNVSLPIKKLKSTISLGPNASHRKGISVLNGQTGDVIQNSVGGSVNYSFRHNDKADFRVGADYSFQQSTYELNKRQNQDVVNRGYSGEVNIRPKKNLHLHSNFTYRLFNNPNTNFKQGIPIWNASVSRFVMKNNAGEFKFAALNILDRNLGINLYSSENGVTRSTMNALGGYYMMSFTYSLNNGLKK